MRYKTARSLFGQRLKALRIEHHLTQEQLAEQIGKTTEHISFLERGERSPSFEVLFDLAHVFQISLSYLVDIDLGIATDASAILTAGTVDADQVLALPQAVTTHVERSSDLDRLERAFAGIRDMQRLANDYGINDILQDNGGKVLQVLILLGLRISPGREGNDAIDAEGNEYELKTVNRALRKGAGITTHHHLNRDIIAKYRAVKAWYIAIYEGIELIEIYKVPSALLEPLFTTWEQKIDQSGPINNPKIPIRYVHQGERVYPIEPTLPQQTSLSLSSD
ncbi:helix-turn-helix domain-containing protein [Herpetosiphon gulosus]|uniref:HTH cro/C1-type domain-containing protein n=1 Tax=Herpetosiphon gulosus TaxID=1973496 RepID=A0ABP9X8X3_9CHLR